MKKLINIICIIILIAGAVLTIFTKLGYTCYFAIIPMLFTNKGEWKNDR